MLSFKQYLIEVLNPDQEEYVKKVVIPPDRGTRPTDFSNHIFDAKNPPEGGTVLDPHTTVFKFPTHDINAENAVRLHLHRNGYVIHDFAKGLAVRHDAEKPRPISIGKILSKPIPAPVRQPHFDDETHGMLLADHARSEEERKNTLAMYNASTARKYTGKPLELMITRDPFKLAQMSTNTHWTSCLSLGTCPNTQLTKGGIIKNVVQKFGETLRSTFSRKRSDAPKLGKIEPAGSNVHRVRDVVQSGSHAAFVIHPGDYDLKNPVARVSLIPYHGVDQSQFKPPAEDGPYVNSSDSGHPIIDRDDRHTMSLIAPFRMGRFKEASWKHLTGKQDVHTILRPSLLVYGAGEPRTGHNTGFPQHIKNAVGSIVKRLLPMRPGNVYGRDPRAHNDVNPEIWSPEHESGSHRDLTANY